MLPTSQSVGEQLVAATLTAVLAMDERTRQALVAAPGMDRLQQLVAVDVTRSVIDFADPGFERALADADILLTCWGAPHIDNAALARMPKLQAIVHAGGSIKGIVDEAAFGRGIRVTSAVDANAIPVAEFTFASIIFAAKRVNAFIQAKRADRSSGPWDLSVADVGGYGRTIGVVGASHIGRRVLSLLRQLDVTVLVADPTIIAADAQKYGAEHVELDDLCRRSDIVTLHAPDLPQTRHLLDERRLAFLRDGATVINTARGALVDTEALIPEVVSGRLSAVLDVTDPEPLPADSPLYDAPNVQLTPHIAGSLGNELGRLLHYAINEIVAIAAEQPPLYPVAESEYEASA